MSILALDDPMGRLHRGRVIIGDITADLLARGAMAGLILLKQLFQAFDMLLETLRFHSFALLILAPDFPLAKTVRFDMQSRSIISAGPMITAGAGKLCCNSIGATGLKTEKEVPKLFCDCSGRATE